MDFNNLPDEYKDTLWRLKNLYYITNKKGKKVLFVPSRAQADFILNCDGQDIVLKCRQLGFTTLACIISLDECVFFDDWNAAIIAHKQDDAKVIFETKVKYPYINLPQWLRDARPAKNDAAGLLSFKHGSTIRVTSSGRSGTLQRLHISEFGKICAKMPEKAREIVTGAFPAVGDNNLTIESTAEGQAGDFYRYCVDAMNGKGEFKFHFYPWWEERAYRAEPKSTTITDAHERYFLKLFLEDGIELDDEQKAWYVKEEYKLGGDMKRENPSTPKEAFEAAIEGAYFAAQLEYSHKHEMIGHFPADPNYPVYTWWDLGLNDMNTIWFHQYIRGRHRFIHYYENSGEKIGHYIQYIRDYLKRFDLHSASDNWPHDGRKDDLFYTAKGRLGMVKETYAFTPNIIPRFPVKLEAIEAARKIFPGCDFHEKSCSVGLKRLAHYRKEWHKKREVFLDNPYHDVNSNGADGFMTFATGWNDPQHAAPPKRSIEYEVRVGRALSHDYDDDDGNEIDYRPGRSLSI